MSMIFGRELLCALDEMMVRVAVDAATRELIVRARAGGDGAEAAVRALVEQGRQATDRYVAAEMALEFAQASIRAFVGQGLEGPWGRLLVAARDLVATDPCSALNPACGPLVDAVGALEDLQAGQPAPVQVPDPPADHFWVTGVRGGVAGPQAAGRLVCVTCTGVGFGGLAQASRVVLAAECLERSR